MSGKASETACEKCGWKPVEVSGRVEQDVGATLIETGIHLTHAHAALAYLKATMWNTLQEQVERRMKDAFELMEGVVSPDSPQTKRKNTKGGE